jgi:UTP--glucose-1-phosphate uridylyltransferase
MSIKAIIPAAGLGTRLLPATKAQPKEMLPVIDTPIIELVIREAAESGIEDILIITGAGKEALERHLNPKVRSESKHKSIIDLNKLLAHLDIFYKHQSEQKGLGDAVLQGKRHIFPDDYFALLLADDFYLDEKPATKQIIDVYKNKQLPIISVIQVKTEDVVKYGIVSVEKNNGMYMIKDIVEKPTLNEAQEKGLIIEENDKEYCLAVSGRYILPSKIFSVLKKTGKGYGGEIQLTDAIKTMIQNGQDFIAYEFKGRRYDMGTPKGVVEGTIAYALNKCIYNKEELQHIIKNSGQ